MTKNTKEREEKGRKHTLSIKIELGAQGQVLDTFHQDDFIWHLSLSGGNKTMLPTLGPNPFLPTPPSSTDFKIKLRNSTPIGPNDKYCTACAVAECSQ